MTKLALQSFDLLFTACPIVLCVLWALTTARRD